MTGKIHQIFLFFFLLGFSFSAFAQFSFNENSKNAYYAIIDLNFDKGQKLIEREKKTNPQNHIVYYLENYIDFLTLAIGQEHDKFEILKTNKENRIDALKNANQNSSFYRFCIANIHLQWAYTRLQYNEYFTAALEINKAYRLLDENQTEYPEFIPNYVGLGILHTIIGTIPDKYKWFVNIIGMQGTIEQGVSELKLVFNNSKESYKYEHLKAESLFFLSFIQLNLINDKDRAMEIVSLWDELQGSSPLKTFSKARILMRTSNNDEAINVLLANPQIEERFPFHYLDYLLGIAKLNRLDNDAVNYLLKYVTNYDGVNYINYSFQKIAWYYLINGDTNNYFKYINKITDNNSMLGADKQALKEFRSGYIPNVFLLRARLLFDGGYYKNAVNILDEIKNSELKNFKDSLEYRYRYGRIFHEWGKTKKAILYYKEVIDKGKDEDCYFAANSALKSGNIYESTGDFEKATYYYNKCLAMSFDEYETGIKQKAKAGLNRIRN